MSKTQNEIYLELIEKQKKLNDRAVSIKTTIELEKEQYNKLLLEIKEKFNVNSLDELREFRKQKFNENEKILKEYAEKLEKQEKEITEAENKIKEAKKEIN